MVEILITSIVIGLWSFHVTRTLTEPGEVLHGLWRFAAWVVDPGYIIRGQDYPTIDGATWWRYWFWKITTCGKCQAFYWAFVVACYKTLPMWLEFAGQQATTETAAWLFTRPELWFSPFCIYASVGSFTAWFLDKKLG